MATVLALTAFSFQRIQAGEGDEGSSGGSNIPDFTFEPGEKATLSKDKQSIGFHLTHTVSNATIKYRTDGWKVKVTLDADNDGTKETYVNIAKNPFDISGNETNIYFTLSDFFTTTFNVSNYVKLPSSGYVSEWLYWENHYKSIPESDRLSVADFNGGVNFTIDALQTILINGSPVTIQGSTDAAKYGFDATEWQTAWGSLSVVGLWEYYDNASASHASTMGMVEAVGVASLEKLGLRGVKWSPTATSDLKSYHNLDFSANIKIEPRKVIADLDVTSTDFTLGADEPSLPVDLQVTAKLDPTQTGSKYYGANDIDRWEIYIADQLGNGRTRAKGNPIVVSNDDARVNQVTKSITIDYSRFDLNVGTNDMLFSTEVYVYYKDNFSTAVSSDDQAIQVLTVEPSENIAVILALDKPRVNVNEDYTLTNRSYIPNDHTTTKNILYEINGGVETPVAGWNGKSITLSKPAIGTPTYRLDITTNKGMGSAAKTVTIEDNTPVNLNTNISAPGSVYEGETYKVYNRSTILYGDETLDVDKADDKSLIDGYTWSVDGNSGGGGLQYLTENYTLAKQERKRVNYTLEMTVDGVTQTDTDYTHILPTPDARVSIDGELKENRKVTFTDTTVWHPSYVGTSTFSVKAVSDGLTDDDIKTGDGKNFLFKKAGDYAVTIQATDTRGFKDRATFNFHIEEDLVPEVKFGAQTYVLRNTDTGRALVNAKDIYSRSIDYDSIAKRVWGYQYSPTSYADAANARVTLTDSGNNKKEQFNLHYAGYYILHLEGVEKFGSFLKPDKTILQFITDSDYKRSTHKLNVHVDNAPPISTIDAKVQQMVNLSIMNGTGALRSDVSTKIDALKTELLSRGIMVNDVDLKTYNAKGQIFKATSSYVGPKLNLPADPNKHDMYLGRVIGIDLELNRAYTFDWRLNVIDLDTGKTVISHNIPIDDYMRGIIGEPDYYALKKNRSRDWYKINRYTGAIEGNVDEAKTISDITGNASSLFGSLPKTQNYSIGSKDAGVPTYTRTDAHGNKIQLSSYSDRINYKVWDKNKKLIIDDEFYNDYYNHIRIESWMVLGKELTVFTWKKSVGQRQDVRTTLHAFVLYGDEYWHTSWQKISNEANQYFPESTVQVFGDKVNLNTGLIWANSNWDGKPGITYRVSEHLVRAINKNDHPNLSNILLPYEYMGFDAHGNVIASHQWNWYASFGPSQLKYYRTNTSRNLVPLVKSSDLSERLIPDDGVFKNYVVLFNDGDLKASQSLIDTAKQLNNSFIEVASTQSNPNLTQSTGGTYIDTKNGFNAAVNQIADHIESAVDSATDKGSNVVNLVKGQSLSTMTGTYWDYESDPIITTDWVLKQDLSEFDHHEGVSTYHNKTFSSPILTLDKVGKYHVDYRVKDNPPDPQNLDNGKYSLPGDFYIRYHRKPVAVPDYKAYLGSETRPNVFTRNTVMSLDLSQSYDPDVTGGITESKVLWMHESDSTFKVAANQTRFNLSKDGQYTFKVTVKDIWGAWSDPVTTTITVSGAVAIQRAIDANFNVPSTIYVNQPVTDVTAKAETINTTLVSETIEISESGQNNWTSVNVANFRNSRHIMTTEGQYDVRYTVRGTHNTTDTVTDTFEVKGVNIQAKLLVKGAFKENRKLSLEVKEMSSNRFTIDRIQTRYLARGNGGVASTKKEAYISKLKRDFLHKDSGDYTVEVTLYTTINSVVYSKVLTYDYTIVPDEAPTLDIVGMNTLTRNERGIATLNLKAVAGSKDDFIDTLQWWLQKGSGPWTLMSANDGLDTFSHDLKDVATYTIKVKATEGYLEETILSFITATDYLSAEKTFKVDVVNQAPNVRFITDKPVYLLGELVNITTPDRQPIVTQADNLMAYSDPDGDALGTFKWTVTHNKSVMPNQDNLSRLNGLSTTKAQDFIRPDARGQYTITGTGTDALGMSGSKSVAIIVHEAPIPDVTLSSAFYSAAHNVALENTTLTVKDASIDPDGYPVTSIIQYKEIGGTYNTIADGATIHLSTKDIMLKVTATDNYGVSRTAYKLITVVPNSLNGTVTPASLPITETITLNLETDTNTVGASAVIFQGKAFETTVAMTFVNQDADHRYYTATYPVPNTIADADYTVEFQATTKWGFKAYASKPLKVSTPINLQAPVPTVITDLDNTITATTSIYTDSVTVNVFDGTSYEQVLNMTETSRDTATKTWQATYKVGKTIPLGNYNAVFNATTPNGNLETLTKTFELISLRVISMNLWGEWHYWRGQTNLLGKKLPNMPHRFLSYEKVHVEAVVQGAPDTVTVRFSPELEAMTYVNSQGIRYDYQDHIGHQVAFPLALTSVDGLHYSAEYILPLAPNTMDDNNLSLRPQYWVMVTAKKGSATDSMSITDIDLTGNILNHMYIQPE